ncbi:hypothetical protein CPLU01_03639 [Colletotrichum plurivorum]|uniref:Uncharacterized protein n=1 Tax=Colletotrichum plurivorum TaxID=2175906 RepID=A0A8H6KRY9_9PEZI|nr:hypothetical protein CPLU01_03639 [Colletotrichum plurivorum]
MESTYNAPNPGPLNEVAQPANVDQWVRPRIPSTKNILGAREHFGDHQVAYKLLNLHSRDANTPARRPSPRQFRDWCNEIFMNIWEGSGTPGSEEHRRAIAANRRVLGAMDTLAGIRRPGHPDWTPNQQIRISPGRNDPQDGFVCDDFPVDLNGNNWDQRVYVPATYAVYENHYAIDRHRPREQNEPRMRRKWAPTQNMLEDARERRDEDAKEHIACFGFRARPHFMFPDDKTDEEKQTLEHTFYAAPVPRNEDSLWYSISYIFTHTLNYSKNFKFLLARWFDEVLTMPRNHWNDQPGQLAVPEHQCRRSRFRMYCQLLANSVRSVDEDDVEEWGNLDLIRCLHRNARESGVPMEAGFHEMLNLVADFFGCEVITFTPPEDAPRLDTADNMANYMAENPYEMRVYGKPHIPDWYPEAERCQIVLVTDSQLRYFQPVLWALPSEIRQGQATEWDIPTAAFDPWDRYSVMPWWPGFQRIGEGEDETITGDWEDEDTRRSFSNATRRLFIPHDIHAWLADASGQSVKAPYWKFGLGMMAGEGVFWDGDADSDRSYLEAQDAAVRDRWTLSEPSWVAPVEDPPLPMRSFAAASVGPLDGRFRSDRHYRGLKRMADCHLEQYPNHAEVDDIGFLKIHATEVEDRSQFWHKRRRKYTVG